MFWSKYVYLDFGPSLMFTLVPSGRFAPAPGEEDLTTSLPVFFPFFGFGLVTFPSAQCAAFSADFAWPCVLPFSLGTTHSTAGGGGGGGGVGFAVNVAVTAVFAFSVIVQGAVPEHPPPDQPEKLEPEAAVAARVTLVPNV